MAKGNLFLGMGRGKVGDVVFYRMNGWQMARVRNRTPKNPRSNEQLYQRAVIATVMKAYSLGKEIFDHSFQGYTVGEGCMRRFNSLNARILRAQLANEVNKNFVGTGYTARFVAPKSTSATPLIGMQVSEGTLTNTLFHVVKNSESYNWVINSLNNQANIPAMLESYGVSAGDIFTFVFMIAKKDSPVYKNPWHIDEYASQYNTEFGWVRLTVKDNLSEELGPDNTKWSDVFEIEQGGNNIPSFASEELLKTGNGVPIDFGSQNISGVSACIRSRNDVDLRSTAYTYVYKNNGFGIAAPYVLEVWQNEIQKIGESELILEGGDNLATYSEEGDNSTIVNSPENESVLPARGRRKA